MIHIIQLGLKILKVSLLALKSQIFTNCSHFLCKNKFTGPVDVGSKPQVTKCVIITQNYFSIQIKFISRAFLLITSPLLLKKQHCINNYNIIKCIYKRSCGELPSIEYLFLWIVIWLYFTYLEHSYHHTLWNILSILNLWKTVVSFI